MKTTVKECLQLDVFRKARLVAGEGGLENRIRYACVLEPVGAETLMNFEDVEDGAFITGFTEILGDVEKQCLFVEKLSEKKASMLITVNVKGGIDDSVVERAEALGLPLVAFEEEKVSFNSIIDAITNYIVYGNSFNNNLINNTIFHLLDFDKHPNFQSAIRKAALLNGFQVVLFNENFGQILAIENRHQVTVDEAIRAAKEKKIGNGTSNFYTKVGVNGILTYWGVVSISGEKYLMLICDNEDQYTVTDMTKLAEIIELAMGMWKYTPEKDLNNEFIRAICRGNAGAAKSIADEKDIQEKRIISVFVGNSLENKECEEIIAEFEDKYDLKVVKYNDGDEICGVIINKAADREDSKSCCLEMFGRLKEIEDVRVYHVTGFDGIDGACDAYQLITEARACVSDVFPFKRVFTKYELALVCNCVNIQEQGGFVKKTYIQLLEVFKSIGTNKGRQLLDTLETFVLDAGMNSSKTSDFMGIHPNTVQYRLKKINELLGAEITANRVLPGLTIALALKRIERNA